VRESYLFSSGDLRGTLENNRQKMLADIDAYDSNKLLNTAEDTLVDYFASEYEVEPLQIAPREDVSVEVKPTKVDARNLPNRAVFDYGRPVPVDGTLVRVHVPFSGEPQLLLLQASTHSLNPPQATVSENTVVFEHWWGGTPPDSEVTRWVEEQVSNLRLHVTYQTDDLQHHKREVRSTALSRIQARRSHLLASQNLQAALPFKMHPRSDAPLTFTPEGVKRRPRPAPPPPASGVPHKAEVALSNEQFEDILRTIRAMGHSMERMPGAYVSMNEESLRAVLLTSLNAQYEGGATGETFNVLGKTDILIRQGDRNLFTGECKIWDGPKSLRDAIDQVLAYLAWRDTRAAVILFVRRKDFGPVVEKIPATVKEHTQFRRELGQKDATEWHYGFAQHEDATREVTLAVIAFHLPVTVSA